MSEHAHTEQSSSRAIVGRGAALLDRLADDLSRSFGGPPLAKDRRDRLNRHRVGRLMKRQAGGAFEVSLVDDAGEPTGYIAKVAITYERFDADEANRTRS